MQRCNEGAVGLVREGEGLCAVRMRLVELEAVVDDRVGLEVLWLVSTSSKEEQGAWDAVE